MHRVDEPYWAAHPIETLLSHDGNQKEQQVCIDFLMQLARGNQQSDRHL